MNVSTGEYHDVTIRQDVTCYADVTVNSPFDHSQIDLGMSHVFESFRLDALADIYVGGIPANLTYIPENVHENFTGCISYVTWDDRELQYGTSIEVSHFSYYVPVLRYDGSTCFMQMKAVFLPIR